jgi:hypothetical protein
MDPRARIADALAQMLLKRGLAILVFELDAPKSARMLICQSGEALPNCGKVACIEKFCRSQHLGMGDRRLHIVAHEARIERVVLCGRVREHARIEGGVLVPKKAHESPR